MVMHRNNKHPLQDLSGSLFFSFCLLKTALYSLLKPYGAYRRENKVCK